MFKQLFAVAKMDKNVNRIKNYRRYKGWNIKSLQKSLYLPNFVITSGS